MQQFADFFWPEAAALLADTKSFWNLSSYRTCTTTVVIIQTIHNMDTNTS
jgi:hypothetical protein